MLRSSELLMGLLQMRALTVKSFSCIDRAVLKIADLTVIIGPQASGKSVLCKLFYFFGEMFHRLPNWITDDGTPALTKARILEEFSEWFQPQTWGTRPFQVTYETGAFSITIRRGSAKKGHPKPKVELSEAFERLLDEAAEVYQKYMPNSDASKSDSFERGYRAYDAIRRIVRKRLGLTILEDLLYIPAGRSFFTSIGKIVTAFEGRSLLEPVVDEFGRLFAHLREDDYILTQGPWPLLKNIEELLDGKIVQGRDKSYLETPDGRKIPFGALSSGQQELLPLLYALRYIVGLSRETLTFVEEPEAHLFPDAQTSLIEMFAQMTSASQRNSQSSRPQLWPRRRIVITTHSPYVLAKINNLIKAGQLAPRLSARRRSSLKDIVPLNSWIDVGGAAAYAIHDRQLIPILDEYGLIDSAYIDAVSEQTGMEFDALLDLEASL
jgi:hypothetical protein